MEPAGPGEQSRHIGEIGESGAVDSRAAPAASLGPVLGGAGQDTRGRYTLLEQKETEAGWGIVHLYREGGGRSAFSGQDDNADDIGSSNGSDGTILCIPAVPSYLTPRDFLGFVGETWSHDVTHYRMVLTSRTNRYMVLLKFRDRSKARAWRSAFDGRVFNSMEAEICHVAFIKSITIETPAAQQTQLQTQQQQGGQRPGHPPHRMSHSGKEAEVLRPFPPPTADLVELPTCPVCLERMDDTAGIMTILCQHVFHCTCLQTWKGSGCPVCRATNPSPMAAGGSGEGGHGPSSAAPAYDPSNPLSRPFAAGGAANLCSVCDCSDDLWICLICGNVGCGRYKGGHAKDHWKDTMHSFSLELETQHVWDYAGDMWVHRLLRNKGDGKIVELPSRPSRGLHPRRRRRHHSSYHGNENVGSSRGRDGHDYSDEDGSSDDDDYDEYAEEEEVVPRAKLDNIGFEYTHLLTSQLESQRLYFEELVNKAADKASKAAASADAAVAQTAEAMRELKMLHDAHTALADTTVPTLERDVERERRRADKASELARSLGKSLQDEKRVSEGLMVRIRHVQDQMTTMQEQLAASQAETVELRETNRDLSMFISGQEKLRELEAEGQLDAGEVEEGTASVPEEKAKGKSKGKGRRK